MKLLISTATAFAALAAATGANGQATTPQGYSSTIPTASQDAKGQAQAQAKGNEGIKVSAKARPAIAALQKAVNANDKAQIPALLAAAQAASTTNEDRWFVGELQLKAAVAAQDYAGMASAVDAIVATGIPTPARVGELYKGIAGNLYNAKQYGQAAALFEKASKANPADVEALTLLGQSLFLGGRPADAVSVMQRVIAANSTGGRKADENLYRVAVQAAFEGNSPAATDIAKQWLVAYPSADSWRNTLLIYRKFGQLDDTGTLALLRLMNLTGGLKSAADYSAYVKGLLTQNNFNEAHAVVEQGIAAGVLTASSPDAVTVAAKPRASVADLTAAAKTAQSGMALLKIGDRLYGMGEYAKAADLYRQAKAKGVDAGTADLYTGIALARAGDKAGATAALKSVTGPQAGVAIYWLLYLEQKG